ncbi:type IV pilus biogenesis protein FimU [Paraferrimonas sedimenticola]|uniref:Type II secretion system protein H n=1 Tax=Paraferrimonas sedimenticola TaxID=375674 RepID=A0AA37W212_9GAMM|nr:type IV pilus biogenesis protein FimU [Paraferrimonas sedimenticola]
MIELLITIVVAVVLIGYGVPKLSDLYDSQRAQSAASRIQSTVLFARNQAMSYSARVTICPLSNNSCGNNWRSGFSVFIEAADGSVVEVLRKIDAFDGNDKLIFTHNALRFDANGSAGSTSGNFTYCASGKSDNARRVEVQASGRSSLTSGNYSCG